MVEKSIETFMLKVQKHRAAFMSININLPQNHDFKPHITVFGVGGAGGNAVNNMVKANLEGVEFWVANTDAQALENSLTKNRIQLGADSTRGLGAGANRAVGANAAEESLGEIQAVLEDSNMVFITAGMGGGTGTGAAPVIAKLAKDMGILTVGVVTKPFQFEGSRRMHVAEAGLEEMQQYVDTLIVIPNQNLFRIANEHTTFVDAFAMADEVLHAAVRGVTDLIVMPGLINLDFADIKTVMQEMGKAMMGTGEAEGDKRALNAAEAAISNPLLDISSMSGARGVIINITGGMDMTLFEVDAAANRIKEEVDADANIIVGSAFNETLDGKIRVSVVATGIDCQMESAFYNANLSLNRRDREAISEQNAPIEKVQKEKARAAVAVASASAFAPASAPAAAEQEDVISEFEPKEEHSVMGLFAETAASKAKKEDSLFFDAASQESSDDDAAKISNNSSIRTNIRDLNVELETLANNNEDKEAAEPEPVVEGKTRDFFDIPAFLRKKVGGKK